jgi:hypothetical protein
MRQFNSDSDPNALEWPEKPYRGLNYLRPQDRPLLGGRSDDISVCTGLLAHPQTRVLLLHGATGCGKSSFLRAGLIPSMEEQDAGYLFLKTSHKEDEALFIRCTDTPTDQIASQIFSFCSQPFELRTPTGSRQLSLAPALLGASGLQEYFSSIRQDGNLIQSLRRITEIIPLTLVLIIDQAEEVLTLNLREENYVNRSRFFCFLRDFQQLRFDARIVVSLRTEYFGRFVDAIRLSYRAGAEFQHFFLGDLSRNALIEAILRPTWRHEIGKYGVPYKFYNFSFEDQLPEKIVDDILDARYSGPALPILQLVCFGLYEDAKQHNRPLVTFTEYTNKGGIEGQLICHISGSIHMLYSSNDDFQTDIKAVRGFLAQFYMMQDDGTVCAFTRSRSWAMADIANRHLRLDADTLVTGLAGAQTMILRTLQTVKEGGAIVDELTLGHDSVALALERWKAILDADQRIQELEMQQKAEINELHAQIDETTSEIKSVTSLLPTSIALVLNLLVASLVVSYFFLGETDSLSQVAKALQRLLGNTIFPSAFQYSSEIFDNLSIAIISAIFGSFTFININQLVQQIRMKIRKNSLQKNKGFKQY